MDSDMRWPPCRGHVPLDTAPKSYQRPLRGPPYATQKKTGASHLWARTLQALTTFFLIIEKSEHL